MSERKLGAQKVTLLFPSLLCEFCRKSKSTSLSNSDEHKGFAEIVHPNFLRLAFLVKVLFCIYKLGLKAERGRAGGKSALSTEMKQLSQIISTRDRAAQSYEPLMDDVHLMLSFLGIVYLI